MRSGYCESASDLDTFDGAHDVAGASAIKVFVALARTAELE